MSGIRILRLIVVAALFTTLGSVLTLKSVKTYLKQKDYEAYWYVVCRDVDNKTFFFEDLHVTHIDQDGQKLSVNGYTTSGKEYKIRANGWCVLRRPRSMQ